MSIYNCRVSLPKDCPLDVVDRIKKSFSKVREGQKWPVERNSLAVAKQKLPARPSSASVLGESDVVSPKSPQAGHNQLEEKDYPNPSWSLSSPVVSEEEDTGGSKEDTLSEERG